MSLVPLGRTTSMAGSGGVEPRRVSTTAVRRRRLSDYRQHDGESSRVLAGSVANDTDAISINEIMTILQDGETSGSDQNAKVQALECIAKYQQQMLASLVEGMNKPKRQSKQRRKES